MALAEEEERLLEEFDGNQAAVRKAMASKDRKAKGNKKKTGGKKRSAVDVGTWVRCRVVDMAPMMGPGPFEDQDVGFVKASGGRDASGWILAISKKPPKVQALMLPWAAPPVITWREGGEKREGMSQEPSDLRQAALDAESKRHALAADLEMTNSGSAVDIQHLQLVSNSKAGSAVVHSGAKLCLSHGCSVLNSCSSAGHGVVAEPGSQITLENMTIAQCTGVGLVVRGGVAAKLEGVDIGHCGEGGVAASKGSTLSLDWCRIHQCTGGPGIRADAPSGGGLVVRNCEIACIGGAAGIELHNAVKKVALKSAAQAVLLSARSRGLLDAGSSAAHTAAASATGHADGSARPDRMCAAEAAAEAWLRESGPSWRQTPPAGEDEDDSDGSEDAGSDEGEPQDGEYLEEEADPQRGMYPGALRVHPYLKKVAKEREAGAAVETLKNLTNAMAFMNGLRADAGLLPASADAREGGDESEYGRSSSQEDGTSSSERAAKERKEKKKKKEKPLSSRQKRQLEEAEAKKRAAEEQAAAEAKAREEWPIVCQTEVWGCGASGVEILGKFDGTIRDNVIELNSAEGLALSSEAGGVVRANRSHSNGLDGVSRRRRTSGFFLQEEGGGGGGGGGDEPGETLLAENYGQNWCVGAAVSCKVRQRLDVMPATWRPSGLEWCDSTERELGRRVPKVDRLKVAADVVLTAAVTEQWKESGGGWRPEQSAQQQ